MNAFSTPKYLYILAAFAWILLLWPYPVTVIMAACVSCALLPLFKRLQARFSSWRGLLVYITMLIVALLIPLSLLVRLVAPQARAGVNAFKTLQENNFQLPEHWMDYLRSIEEKLSFIPGFDTLQADISQNFETFMSDIVTTIIGGGVGLLGSTVNAVWLIFLFFTLSVLCSIYAERIFCMSSALLHMPEAMLQRFVMTIRNALRGVMLGVICVAIAQGVLCGIGFAFAGIKQPAFWGLLATLVAPIPVVGTAIVWFPLCLSLWFTGNAMEAFGLALWGTMAVGGIDNILRPLFLKQNINAPLFVLVLAILCGLASFGAVGIIVGPVLVSLAIQAVQEADDLL